MNGVFRAIVCKIITINATMKAKYRTSTENKVLSPPTKEVQSDTTITNFFKKMKSYIKPSFLDKEIFLHKNVKWTLKN